MLSKGAMQRADVQALIRLASDADGERLRRLMLDELRHLSVLGITDEDRVVGFVAFDVDRDPAVIEYMAVAPDQQGRGHGSTLVQATRSAARDGAVYAETDDDAVEFYRRLGFAVVPRDPDPRWPDRQRYACLLGAAAGG
ncbi:GNAT family N-acetyltransferase [Leucobacter tardus]